MPRAAPRLRIVDPSVRGSIKPARSPDAQARRLLQQRRDLSAKLRQVEFALFEHRRRKADERGQLPPLTIEQLAIAVDM